MPKKKGKNPFAKGKGKKGEMGPMGQAAVDPKSAKQKLAAGKKNFGY
jgi:hypothetical protein